MKWEIIDKIGPDDQVLIVGNFDQKTLKENSFECIYAIFGIKEGYLIGDIVEDLNHKSPFSIRITQKTDKNGNLMYVDYNDRDKDMSVDVLIRYKQHLFESESIRRERLEYEAVKNKISSDIAKRMAERDLEVKRALEKQILGGDLAKEYERFKKELERAAKLVDRLDLYKRNNKTNFYYPDTIDRFDNS